MTDWFRKQPTIKAAAHRLPALPKTPWTKATMPTALPEDKQSVSAKVVMHQFARGEVRNLNKEHDALHAKVVDKLRERPEFAAMTSDQLDHVIKNATYKLQTAQLTINFGVAGWFMKPNTTKTYTQMYERGVQSVTNDAGATELRMKGNFLNPVDVRDAADTQVMFGSNISSPGMQGVARFMATGGVQGVSGVPQTFKVMNGQFNPKARQLFAALNYGRRRNGSAPGYGESYLVLKDSFKHNAIYYLGDTFGASMSAASRITYGTLFAVILQPSKEDVATGLIDSCFRNVADQDTAYTLLEAHIYDQVRFSGDVTEMYASNTDIRRARNSDDIINNMKIFCHTNRIKLSFIA